MGVGLKRHLVYKCVLLSMVPVKTQLLMFLWFDATKENYIRLVDRFGVSPDTASTTVEWFVQQLLITWHVMSNGRLMQKEKNRWKYFQDEACQR